MKIFETLCKLISYLINNKYTDINFCLIYENEVYGNKNNSDNYVAIILIITENGVLGRTGKYKDNIYILEINKILEDYIDELIYTILHEISHIIDIQNGLSLELDTPYKNRLCEIKANEFAEKIIKQLIGYI